MSENTSSSSSRRPRRRRSWGRRLAVVALVCVVLLLVVYFVGTSSGFIKSVILPRAGAAMGSDITVSDLSVSPFSEVWVRDLKVQPKGAEPLFTAKEIRLRYSLLRILRGTIAVEEVLVDSPAVVLVQNADGTSNLDPILKASSGGPSPTVNQGPAPALVLDIKNVTVKNASFRQTIKFKEGGEQVMEVGGGTLALANVKNGESGTLELGADASFRTSQPTNAATTARLDGKLALGLNSAGFPQTLTGGVKFAVTQATGWLADLAQAAVALDADMSPTEIKVLALKLQRAGTDLAQARLSGALDANKHEGTLRFEAFGINREVLNLAGRIAGGTTGLDFGQTSFASTNLIELTNFGRNIILTGQVLGNRVSVSQAGATTPTLELAADYDVTVDQTKSSALVRKVNLTALRGPNKLVDGGLSKAMKFEWGSGATGIDESDFKLALTGLDLRDYRAFLGTNVQSGLLDGTFVMQVKAAGKQIYLGLTAGGRDLAMAAGSLTLDRLGFSLKSSATLNDFEKLQLTEGDFRLNHRNQEAARFQVTGNVSTKKFDSTLMLVADASLPALAELAPEPRPKLTSGRVNYTGAFKVQDVTLPTAKTASYAGSVDGALTMTDLTGSQAPFNFERYGAKVDFDVAFRESGATVRRCVGVVHQAGQDAGAFNLSADTQFATSASKFKLKLTDLNQRALASFLNPFLNGGSLQTVAINADLDGAYDPKSDSVVRGSASMTNLVVQGPGLPAKPLEAAMGLDLALRKQTAEFRNCSLKLTPTPRGKNEVNLTGNLDFSQSNALTGALKLAADTLDLTPYYDLFMSGPAKPATAATPTPTPKPVAAAPVQEPPASVFPVRNFVTEAAFNHLYLRDLDVAKFKTTVKLDGGRTVVKPLEASVNGAPVSASVDFDMGVPGYKYDVQCGAQNVPIPPLVSLVMPERAGQFSGTTTATLAIKGAGITDPNVAKNLAGNFYFGTTNLNFKITDAQSAMVKTVVKVVLGIPEIVRGATSLTKDPLGAVSSMFSKAAGVNSGSAPGWVDQVSRQPVDIIEMRGQVGNSRLDLQQARLCSPAFIAEAAGNVALAPVLTNSTVDLPLQISLSRDLAAVVSLVPAGTPSNVAYVKLPSFVTIKGTVSAPQTDVKPAPLIAMVAQAAASKTSGTTSGVLGAVSGLLGGGTTAAPTGNTNAAPRGTNAPAATSTNATSTTKTVEGLTRALGGLLGGKPKPATTNAPASTNTPPASGR